MWLSENILVLKDRKKITSPPSGKAKNEQKTEKMEDATLMFTILYEV